MAVRELWAVAVRLVSYYHHVNDEWVGTAHRRCKVHFIACREKGITYAE